METTIRQAQDIGAARHPKNNADLVIAATALEHGLALVTRNAAHFAWIADLTFTAWRQS